MYDTVNICTTHKVFVFFCMCMPYKHQIMHVWHVAAILSACTLCVTAEHVHIYLQPFGIVGQHRHWQCKLAWSHVLSCAHLIQIRVWNSASLLQPPISQCMITEVDSNLILETGFMLCAKNEWCEDIIILGICST